MKPWRLAFLALLVAAHSLLAQPVLRLKGIGAKADMQEPSALGGAEALKAGTHTIVQMEEHADLKEALDELIRRGARVVAYVPDGAALVWTEEAIPLDGLPVAWAGELRSGWKLSGELVYAGAMTVVAEFHPDVDIELARTRAVGLGLAIREHPDLAAGHLIVTGEPDQIWRLAELDETAYVYPVSPELAGGEAVHACASAITAVGPVGQYVATVGDGWDGPGRGAAALSFVFGPLTDRLSAEQSKSEIRRAFDAWSSVAAIDFQEATGTGLQRSIAILFGEGDHGDGYPFDGPGRGLAHTFFPAPPNPEPIAGDMHLDGAEPWRAGADVDLFSVALHELGHALGLGHSDRPGAVMYPYYRQAAGLTAEDIAAIRTLYAARETNPSEPPPQPPPPRPSAPLALTVTPPASPVRLASVVVQGSAAGGSGSVRVTWVSDRGGTGWLDLPV
ncbi:MAG TPA: hypothetical protein DEH78_05745, partial [Solibacterales bacterium]|nr:hypothetical protein [Bryobacterales bacterium]